MAVAAVVVVYFLATAGFNFMRMEQLRRQEDQVQAEIRTLQQRYQRLEALKAYLNSDEYIEAVAREELGLVRKGERAFIAISTVPTPTPAPDETQPRLWWEILTR